MAFLLALILGALCPIWAPVAPTPTTTPVAIVTIIEGQHPTFDVTPPTRLDVMLVGPESTMLARCDDMGGVLVDNGRCGGVDY